MKSQFSYEFLRKLPDSYDFLGFFNWLTKLISKFYSDYYVAYPNTLFIDNNKVLEVLRTLLSFMILCTSSFSILLWYD